MAAIYTIYIRLRHSFGQAAEVEKFDPPANVSQFKHWIKLD